MREPQKNEPASSDSPIIYFDGVCGLCNGLVDFVALRDHAAVFRFAPLQGQTFQERQTRAAGDDTVSLTPMESIVLGDGAAGYFKSDAVIRILEILGGKWKLLIILRLIPKSLRDAGYDFVARNRYHWFGKRESCRIPTAEERDRFLP